MTGYSPSRRTALVLTGTGAHGAYHAGVLRALQEAGVKIDLIAGHGVGAGGAALAAIDGAARLWDADGDLAIARARGSSIHGAWPLRVAAWIGLVLVTILLTPVFVLLVGLLVYLVGFLFEMLQIEAGPIARGRLLGLAAGGIRRREPSDLRSPLRGRCAHCRSSRCSRSAE